MHLLDPCGANQRVFPGPEPVTDPHSPLRFCMVCRTCQRKISDVGRCRYTEY